MPGLPLIQEINPTGAMGVDFGNRKRFVRKFIVGVHVASMNESVENFLGEDGEGHSVAIPKRGDHHPRVSDQFVICDRIEADEIESSAAATMVVCSYSNDAAFSYASSRDPLTLGASWTIAAHRVTMSYPIAFLEPDARQVPDNLGTLISVPRWNIDAANYFQTFIVLSRKILLTHVTSGDLAAIAEQVDKLHLFVHPNGGIGGGSYAHWYRFSAGAMVQTTRTSWETTYNWELDPGLVDIQPPSNYDPATMVFPESGPPTPNDPLHRGGHRWAGTSNWNWARPPFHQFVVIPGLATLSNPRDVSRPRFEVMLPYAIGGASGNGWATLPGNLELPPL